MGLVIQMYVPHRRLWSSASWSTHSDTAALHGIPEETKETRQQLRGDRKSRITGFGSDRAVRFGARADVEWAPHASSIYPIYYYMRKYHAIHRKRH